MATNPTLTQFLSPNLDTASVTTRQPTTFVARKRSMSPLDVLPGYAHT
jgi:hypothetical protein